MVALPAMDLDSVVWLEVGGGLVLTHIETPDVIFPGRRTLH
jgi:hypothetical protein